MKFLHLSDTHFHEVASNDEVAKRFNFIKSTYPTHQIILTGDLTDDGQPLQYEYAIADMPDNILICPGNHDYGLVGSLYSEQSCRLFDQYTNTSYFDKLPVVNIIDDVLLIGLNSCIKSTSPFDFACGEIGKRQLRSLASALKKFDLPKIVYLHHHPFIHGDPTMQLLDAREFLNVVYNKIDILLFGHKHVFGLWKGGIAKYVIAAGAVFNMETCIEINDQLSIREVPII